MAFNVLLEKAYTHKKKLQKFNSRRKKRVEMKFMSQDSSFKERMTEKELKESFRGRNSKFLKVSRRKSLLRKNFKASLFHMNLINISKAIKNVQCQNLKRNFELCALTLYFKSFISIIKKKVRVFKAFIFKF